VAHIRTRHFAPYLEKRHRAREQPESSGKSVEQVISELNQIRSLPARASQLAATLQERYVVERALAHNQIERLEDLAGVGLSVESASHDIVASGTRALKLSRDINRRIERLTPRQSALESDSFALVELISFVSSRLQDIQGLFVSTRQPKRLVNVSDYVARVQRIYATLLKGHNVTVEVNEKYAELIVSTTDAALLQVLINLFDNSVYWLDAAATSDPRIVIELDSSRKRVLFADNGPGVAERDEPFIFEPFYSGKDDAGKGLGLYIARQVGARSGFEVALVSSPSERLLAGANFQIQFRDNDHD
jgi:signal transduction histidine kinase